jgi:UDP-glucose 4-epimerase
MHVLVTGGAGFIGSHLVELLLRKGCSVCAVDNLSTGQITNIANVLDHPRFQFEEADIVTWDGLWSAARSADRIYHLAAVVGVRRVLESPVRVLATNIAGTERVLRAVAASGRRPRVMVASTSEVYGFAPNGERLRESDNLVYKAGSLTRWSYAVSKLAAEHLVHAYAREHHLPMTAMRFFNVIGPRQRGTYGMVVPNFVRQAVRELPITVYGDGCQTRSFCDVRDMVRMMDELADAEAALGQIVNIGNDREISINDLAKLVRQRADSASDIRHLSHLEGYGEDFDDVKRRRPDLMLLKTMIDFAPRWTLAETIDELVNHERNCDAHSPRERAEVF